jgi:hypothetical protein
MHYIVHWADNDGYDFISGPLPDITLMTGFGSAFYLFMRKHNCHVHRCWRMQWHVHPVHGHPVCKHHHPQGTTVRGEA